MNARRLILGTLAVALTLPALAQGGLKSAPVWPDDIIRLAERLPVQEGGRVKPLDTYAQFLMLRINGKRSFTTVSGERLGPVAWLLDCMFYPEVARQYRNFVVDNDEAIAAIGVPVHDKKRDRYSYDELLPARERMFTLAQQYQQIDAKKRDLVQQQVLNLANNVFEFEHLIGALDFARHRFSATGDTELAKAFPEAEGVPTSVALERVPRVLMSLRGNPGGLSDAQVNAEATALTNMLDELENAANRAQGVAMFPPEDRADKTWRSAGDLMAIVMQMPGLSVPLRERLAQLETLTDNRDAALHEGDSTERMEAFRAAFTKLQGEIVALAQARDEYSKVPLEVHFYKGQYLFYSQWLYVLSFVLVALSWLLPQSKNLRRALMPAVALPTLLLVIGITLRCIIRGRPPVSTLYETLLFITACAVLVALFIEFANRQGIAIAMGSFLGAVGMFLAHRYELKDGQDTMPSLIAVLDTNFWLSTHVTTVTIGYAAGMLAGALAHVYLIGKLIGFRKNDAAFYRSVTRMVYGVICFGLVFSTVGTILGGIWANDSWGRFWGWDPKENGALMIVLWALVVLHLRMGGYIRQLGLNMCAVVLGMIVAFSWWGVNLLGVGLHSYGFTSGIWTLLTVFWIFELAVLAGGAVLHLLGRGGPTTAATA